MCMYQLVYVDNKNKHCFTKKITLSKKQFSGSYIETNIHDAENSINEMLFIKNRCLPSLVSLFSLSVMTEIPLPRRTKK